jgi:hypothetical protein
LGRYKRPYSFYLSLAFISPEFGSKFAFPITRGIGDHRNFVNHILLSQA